MKVTNMDGRTYIVIGKYNLQAHSEKLLLHVIQLSIRYLDKFDPDKYNPLKHEGCYFCKACFEMDADIDDETFESSSAPIIHCKKCVFGDWYGSETGCMSLLRYLADCEGTYMPGGLDHTWYGRSGHFKVRGYLMALKTYLENKDNDVN